MNRKLRYRYVVLAAGLAVGLLGVAAVPAGAGSSGRNRLVVRAGEYAYEFEGRPRAGLVPITFENQGGEPHILVMERVKKGVTKQQVMDAAMSDDEQAFAALLAGDPEQAFVPGGPEILGPGQKVTVTTRIANPGRYAMICFLPAPDGMPHLAKGMVNFVTVGRGGSTKAPKTTGAVELADTGITLPPSMDTGKGRVKVTNTGQAPHSFVMVRFTDDAATPQSVYDYYNNWFNSGTVPTEEPPADLVGGVATLFPGGTSYLNLNLKPGRYGYLSTEEDPEAGTSDMASGLFGEFEVG